MLWLIVGIVFSTTPGTTLGMSDIEVVLCNVRNAFFFGLPGVFSIEFLAKRIF